MAGNENEDPKHNPQEGGMHYRSEYHYNEPNLQGWLDMRKTLIAARDERGMKRVSVVMDNGKTEAFSIDQAIGIYEDLIRGAGAGDLIDSPKK